MLKYIGLLVFLIFMLSATAGAQTTENEIPADYQSDGCSFFPDGNYRDCCVAHDREYYNGGSCKLRRQADNRLYTCVKNKKGWYNKFVAPIMWVGVRVMGPSFVPTPARWGFGKKKKKKDADKKIETNKEEPVVPKPVENDSLPKTNK